MSPCRNLALRVCKVPLSEAYTDDLEDEKKAEDTATFTPETVIEQSVQHGSCYSMWHCWQF